MKKGEKKLKILVPQTERLQIALKEQKLMGR
jgi:hypothetical protein